MACLAVWTLLVLLACGGAPPPNPPPNPPALTEWPQSAAVIPGAPTGEAPRPAPPPYSGAVRTRIGFRSTRHLADHYEKHGAEFGGLSRDEYLRLAQELRDRPAGGPIREIVRKDGVITRFDRASGTFLAFENDGTLRTCFRPNDGEAYFDRQARRRPR